MQMYIRHFNCLMGIVTPKIISLAIKAGAMDAPDERKVHSKPIENGWDCDLYHFNNTLNDPIE